VSFTFERSTDRFDWIAEGSVVATAVPVHGLWQILDARGDHVVTLMPLSATSGDDRPGLGLVGPAARMLGTIHRSRDDGDESSAQDDHGSTVLVLRGDGPRGSHIVDRVGSVVAVCSWGERSGVIDLLVTAAGTRQSLAMVFGLVLATELRREAPRRVV
jgi:hypothetical protein